MASREQEIADRKAVFRQYGENAFSAASIANDVPLFANDRAKADQFIRLAIKSAWIEHRAEDPPGEFRFRLEVVAAMTHQPVVSRQANPVRQPNGPPIPAVVRPMISPQGINLFTLALDEQVQYFFVTLIATLGRGGGWVSCLRLHEELEKYPKWKMEFMVFSELVTLLEGEGVLKKQFRDRIMVRITMRSAIQFLGWNATQARNLVDNEVDPPPEPTPPPKKPPPPVVPPTPALASVPAPAAGARTVPTVAAARITRAPSEPKPAPAPEPKAQLPLPSVGEGDATLKGLRLDVLRLTKQLGETTAAKHATELELAQLRAENAALKDKSALIERDLAELTQRHQRDTAHFIWYTIQNQVATDQEFARVLDLLCRFSKGQAKRLPVAYGELVRELHHHLTEEHPQSERETVLAQVAE